VSSVEAKLATGAQFTAHNREHRCDARGILTNSHRQDVVTRNQIKMFVNQPQYP
jgi:hypothetical protein